MSKHLLKLILLILSVFAIAFLLIQTFQMLFMLDESWAVNQVLCSMELDNTSTQPMTSDHPVIPSPAETDLIKPNTKP
uniref:Female-specific orf protein n=1 Tax=Lasmigona complanata TaxID=85050 RepID=F4ZFG2_LASCO|nr:female-specific orf protein [Lasmigona complanata]AEC14047.1 female-specific orf protein [Lasmigona complanata]AEC14052.1 female-specific orf protein [Lasmigona complanata]